MQSVKTECRFLVIMLVLSSALLFVLNIYIGYQVIMQFKGDGWSFLGGLIIALPYLFTIPANAFSVVSVKWVKQNKRNKYLVPVILGSMGILSGFLLYNAFKYWWLIVVFSALLLGSCFVCDRVKKLKLNTQYTPVTKTIKDDITSTFRKMKAFQIVDLVFLLLLIIVLIIPSPAGSKIGVFSKVFVFVILLLHTVLSIAFYKKWYWAVKAKYIESYLLSGITFTLFIAFVITDGITLTTGSLATLVFFVVLMSLFVYQIFSYKKIKQSKLFRFIIIAVLGFSFLSSGKLPDRGDNWSKHSTISNNKTFLNKQFYKF